MTPEQIDTALAELETRLDRLRALYEQYFMGIERLEPQVPRKDVDRRFQELRKTPFRNTARRFKFQTLTQRYNTMQQYWGRICREIENGTYKRHRLRAERSANAEALAERLEAEASLGTGSTRAQLEDDLGRLLDGDGDADAELEAALRELDAPRVASPPAAALSSSAHSASAPSPDVTTADEFRRDTSSDVGGADVGSSPSAATAGKGLGLLGKLGSSPTASGSTARVAKSPGLPPLLSRPELSRPEVSRPEVSRPEVPSANQPSGTEPRPTSTAPRPPLPPPRPAPAGAVGGSSRPPLPPPRPASSPGGPAARPPLPAPAGVRPPSARPPGPPPRPLPAGGALPPPAAVPPAAASAQRPTPPPRPSPPPARSPLASVEIDRASIVDAERPSLLGAQARQVAAQAREAASQQRANSLSEERIRAIHKSYLEARAQTNATAVSFEKLAQNVRDTEAKLREQHRG
ncbi:MAG TPA: hypothetical protein VLC09_19760, partial [Polyangiaceae bacterium]|nr:hypothetical protein [Polyangiaceae bacterium]